MAFSQRHPIYSAHPPALPLVIRSVKLRNSFALEQGAAAIRLSTPPSRTCAFRRFAQRRRPFAPAPARKNRIPCRTPARPSIPPNPAPAAACPKWRLRPPVCIDTRCGPSSPLALPSEKTRQTSAPAMARHPTAAAAIARPHRGPPARRRRKPVPPSDRHSRPRA